MRELIDLLLRSNIPLLIIGGHAVGMHGAQRDTIDLDCLVVMERREEIKVFLESRGFEETARHESFSRYRAIRQNPTRELQDGDDIARLLRANPGAIPPEELQAIFERYQLPELFAKVLKAI